MIRVSRIRFIWCEPHAPRRKPVLMVWCHLDGKRICAVEVRRVSKSSIKFEWPNLSGLPNKQGQLAAEAAIRARWEQRFRDNGES